MTQQQFEQEVIDRGFTLAELRCDVPPTNRLFTFMDDVGPSYERKVMRLALKQGHKQTQECADLVSGKVKPNWSTLDFASIEVAPPCDEPEYMVREASL